jgi:hypothetical protein
LVIDRTLPLVASVVLAPTVTNNTPVVISATGSDAVCPLNLCAIGGGEYYIDAAGAAGTGTPMTATSATAFTATIPAATLAGLANGNRTVYVRALDKAGNWSAGTGSATLLVDHTAPTVTGAALSPRNTVAFGVSTTLTLAFNAPTDNAGGSGVAPTRWYWFDGSGTNRPGSAVSFTGNSVTFNTSALTAGTHNVRLQVLDNAGNSRVITLQLFVVRATANAYTATANNLATQAVAVTAANGVLANDQPTGVAGRTATPAAPVATRTGGTGTGTMTVALAADGSFTYTLSSNAATAALRLAAKQGTFQFTYTETLNTVTSTATVTVTVN